MRTRSSFFSSFFSLFLFGQKTYPWFWVVGYIGFMKYEMTLRPACLSSVSWPSLQIAYGGVLGIVRRDIANPGSVDASGIWAFLTLFLGFHSPQLAA